MVQLSFQREFDIPAAAMWERIRDFYAIAAWHPSLTHSGKVGPLQRECIAAETGDRLVEALVDAGAAGERSYRYRNVGGPQYVRNFDSTIEVRELLPHTCLITWDSTFDEGIVPMVTGIQIFTEFQQAGLEALARWVKEITG